MNWREKLKSPTALALQGFIAGAFLFFTVHPLAPGQADLPPPSGAMAISIPA
ncbi:MAG TPA: hypothetical protein VFO69_02810 [Allosphingosinicella sp.]|nr:hypothetical protein [Allosphingosinicella sp.]